MFDRTWKLAKVWLSLLFLWVLFFFLITPCSVLFCSFPASLEQCELIFATMFFAFSLCSDLRYKVYGCNGFLIL